MDIKSAKFVMSNTDPEKAPAPDKPEYAFIGRSNVGKSTLINALTNTKNLAKTSSTPGKTQLINHFIINDGWYLVDLPGYGYARVSQKQRKGWQWMIEEYLKTRENLVNLFVLIDLRHPPQKVDLEFVNKLGEWGVPFSIVFTKADKVKSIVAKHNRNQFYEELQKNWEELPPIFITSGVKRTGTKDLLEYISEVNERLEI